MRIALFILFLIVARVSCAEDCGGVDLSEDRTLRLNLAAHADELVNAEGLLWRVDRPGVAPSYLYGTMHSTQKGPLKLAEAAAVYAKKAKVIATELGDLDPIKRSEASAKMMQAAASPDVDTWKGLITGPDARRVERMLQKKGISPELAHHLKLWALSLVTAIPACENNPNVADVDQYFADLGKAQHIPLFALETIDEQLNVIMSLDAKLVAVDLEAMTHSEALADGGYATLLSFYLQKRPAMASVLLDELPGVTVQERAVSALMTKRLLGDRNAIMVTRSAPLLAKGGVFIAVGALHLSGKGGIVEILRKQGYVVSKIW